MPVVGPCFDRVVAPNGYAWWYIDALSADGRQNLTLIAFVGSVFSPYYGWARRRCAVDPERHVALNVALHGDQGYRWAMTERGARDLRRSADELVIGASSLKWSNGALLIDIDEVCAPFPRRLRGQVRVVPRCGGGRTFDLSGDRKHVWRPIAPFATIEVEFSAPRTSWQGLGYVDFNAGSEPIGEAFAEWSWSRSVEETQTRVFYDVTSRDGAGTSLALRFDGDGATHDIAAPPRQEIARTLWRLPRRIRSEKGNGKALLKTLEDGPFYARSLVEQVLDGEPVRAVHESLSLGRLAAPWVSFMLPFRMPRWAS